MIRKFRKCLKCDRAVYAKKLCRYHYYQQLHKQTKQKKKQPKPIRKLSQSTSARMRRYKLVRKKFFAKPENQLCKVRVEGVCMIHATDVHHMAGRIGELITNTTYFLPVCRACHQHIHKNSAWAEENKFIVHLH